MVLGPVLRLLSGLHGSSHALNFSPNTKELLFITSASLTFNLERGEKVKVGLLKIANDNNN